MPFELGSESTLTTTTTSMATSETVSEPKEPIHSGHFMRSGVHRAGTQVDDDDDSDVDVYVDVCDVDGAEQTQLADAEKPKPVTFYKFGPKRSKSIAIDVSLGTLKRCLTTAYSKLTTPKWKDFKGLRLDWKQRIRLNNVIWRAWHMEFRRLSPDRALSFFRKQRTKFCFFNVPEEDIHLGFEGGAGILEGMYWKRRGEAVCAQYRRWRHFYAHRIKMKYGKTPKDAMCPYLHDCDQQDACYVPQPPSHPPRCASVRTPQILLEDDDLNNPFTDRLFDCLSQPYMFPNQKDITRHATNPDIIQPGLQSLQPSLDEIMASLDDRMESPLLDMNDPTLGSQVILPSPQTRNAVSAPTLQQRQQQQRNRASVSSKGKGDNASDTNLLQQQHYTQRDYAAANLLIEYHQTSQAQSPSFQSGHFGPPSCGPTAGGGSGININDYYVSQPSTTTLYEQTYMPQLTVLTPAVGVSPSSTTSNTSGPASTSLGFGTIGWSNQGSASTSLSPWTAFAPPAYTTTTTVLEHTRTMVSASNLPTMAIPSKGALKAVHQPSSGKPAAGTQQQGGTVAVAPKKVRLSTPSDQSHRAQQQPKPSTSSKRSSVTDQPATVTRPTAKRNSRGGSSHTTTQQQSTTSIGAQQPHSTSTTLITQSSTTGSPQMIVLNPKAAVVTSISVGTQPSQSQVPIAVNPYAQSVLIKQETHTPPPTSSTVTHKPTPYHAAARASPLILPNAPLTSAMLSTSTSSGISTSAETSAVVVRQKAPRTTPTRKVPAEVQTHGLDLTFTKNTANFTKYTELSNFSLIKSVPIDSSSQATSSSQISPGFGEEDETTGGERDKRMFHLLAEQNRRTALKDGFQRLTELLPNLYAGSKLTNAVVLAKTAEHIRRLHHTQSQRQQQLHSVKQQIEKYQAKIRSLQTSLPASSSTSTSMLRETSAGSGVDDGVWLRQRYNKHVKHRTSENWKYGLFSRLMAPVLDSYVKSSSTTDCETSASLTDSVTQWAQQHTSVVKLRPVASDLLVHLATNTPVLHEPDKLAEHVQLETQKL